MILSKLLASGCAALVALAGTPALAAAAATPKLVVAISVDQFSAALYSQYRARYTQGLARLSQGIVYPSGYQSHGVTETCPGHSSLLTGKYPNKTGIVGNNVRDEAAARRSTASMTPPRSWPTATRPIRSDPSG